MESLRNYLDSNNISYKDYVELVKEVKWSMSEAHLIKLGGLFCTYKKG